ncbi:MAG: radical SAM protein [Bacteroidales bacterium]|nr:radical SAM protein [Bacteroidales bacterium]
MEKTISINGSRRTLFELWIKIRVALYFTGLLFKGELKGKYYFRVLKRLLFFLSKMNLNKFIKTSLGTKINLYVPSFPRKAFFNACRKVMEFDEKMPSITVLMSVTSACRYKCEHCYQKLDKGKDVDIGLLVDVARKLQDMGVAFFNIEGGEPFLQYDRLRALCEAIDDRSEILINSTGDGMTYERLLELKSKGNLLGIMFSLHTFDGDRLNAFMKSENAWSNLQNGISLCHKAGIDVTFNSCISREDYYNGNFEKVMETAKAAGATIIQFIKPKPAGGWLESGAEKFSPEDLAHIRQKMIDYNNLEKYRDYTAIAAMIIDEDQEHFGCTAGGTDRFYINAKGDVQPCEFLNISFGNIAEEKFEDIYDRMRKVYEVPGTCWLCEKHAAGIAEILKRTGQHTLPLAPEHSKEIYEHLEKSPVPDFYDKVVKM